MERQIPLEREEPLSPRRGRTRTARAPLSMESAATSRRGRTHAPINVGNEPMETAPATAPEFSPVRASRRAARGGRGRSKEPAFRSPTTAEKKGFIKKEPSVAIYEAPTETRLGRWVRVVLTPLLLFIHTTFISKLMGGAKKVYNSTLKPLGKSTYDRVLFPSAHQLRRLFRWARDNRERAWTSLKELYDNWNDRISEALDWIYEQAAKLDVLSKWIYMLDASLTRIIGDVEDRVREKVVKPAANRLCNLLASIGKRIVSGIQSFLKLFAFNGVQTSQFQLDIVPASRLRDNYFGLRDGQPYEIYIANNTWYRCFCTIQIDGESMGTFLLNGRARTFIQRPVHTQAQFTFIKDPSATAELVREGTSDMGSVVVATFELVSGRRGNARSAQAIDAMDVPENASVYASGRTVLSGYNDQELRQVHAMYKFQQKEPPVALIARLVAK